MDLSLDDYMHEKGHTIQLNKGINFSRAPVSSRLGSVKVRIGNNRTAFDARQKLRNKPANKPAAKVRTLTIQDARQKIMQKTVKDAREHIKNKKAQSQTAPVQDVRIKINNARAKKTPQTSATQVTVTDRGRLLTGPDGGVSTINGSLIKVIRTQPQSKPKPIPVQLQQPQSGGRMTQLKRNNPIRITTRNYSHQITMPVSTPTMSLPGAGSGVVKISNNYYKPPQPPPIRKEVPVVVSDSEYVPPYVPLVLPEHFTPSPKPLAVSKQSVAKIVPVATEDVLSPSKGVRVLITNLHPVVTEEDLVELFGAVGELRRARLMRPGTGEVLYGQRNAAMAAIRKYHNRELDSMPMIVQLAAGQARKPATQRLEQSPPPVQTQPVIKQEPQEEETRQEEPMQEQSQQEEFHPLKLFKGSAKSSTQGIGVDVGALHRALFKTKDSTPTKPVTFTVKI